MKDIFSFEFTNTHRNNVVFDIIKEDNKEKTYVDKILTPETFGLEIEDELKKKGYKLVVNRVK